jgi:hypothetical protein
VIPSASVKVVFHSSMVVPGDSVDTMELQSRVVVPSANVDTTVLQSRVTVPE